MSIRSLRYPSVLLALFVFTGAAAAQVPLVNNSTTTSILEMTATVQSAVQLNISTGSGGATVSSSNSTGLFNVAFGTLDGWGVGTLRSGVTVTVDSSGALYKTPINLTPVYSGLTSEKADIMVQAGTSGDENLAREGGSSISLSSTVNATPTIVVSQANSGSKNERYVGFYVSKTEAAGSKTARLIYTVMVQ
jgi:hypothetical protein